MKLQSSFCTKAVTLRVKLRQCTAQILGGCSPTCKQHQFLNQYPCQTIVQWCSGPGIMQLTIHYSLELVRFSEQIVWFEYKL